MRKTPAVLARELYVELNAAPHKERAGVVRAFMRRLALSRKISLLPRILRAFERLALATEGKQAGLLCSARPIDDTTRKKITSAFPHVLFSEAVDPTLLGGIKIAVDEQVLDATIINSLSHLKRALIHPN